MKEFKIAANFIFAILAVMFLACWIFGSKFAVWAYPLIVYPALIVLSLKATDIKARDNGFMLIAAADTLQQMAIVTLTLSFAIAGLNWHGLKEGVEAAEKAKVFVGPLVEGILSIALSNALSLRLRISGNIAGEEGIGVAPGGSPGQSLGLDPKVITQFEEALRELTVSLSAVKSSADQADPLLKGIIPLLESLNAFFPKPGP